MRALFPSTFLLVLLLFFFSSAFGQNAIRISENINWDNAPSSISINNTKVLNIWNFEDAVDNSTHPSLPYFLKRFPLNGRSQLSVEIINTTFEIFDKPSTSDDSAITTNLDFFTQVNKNRQNYFGKVYFVPIRKTAQGQFERLTSFEIIVRVTPDPIASFRGDNTYSSVLSDGDIYKIAVTKTGIYKMDYSFLKNNLNINVDNIDPRKIKIYGNGGGVLPESNDINRQDDLIENSIEIIGESDGSFDAGDFILFFGEGPHTWTFHEDKEIYQQQRNVYDDKNYYFIKIGSEDGLRISQQNSINETNFTSNSFDDFLHFEEDKFNLLDGQSGSHGSGQKWYGNLYNPTRERTISNYFNFPNITNDPVHVAVEFAAHSEVGSSKFSFSVGTQSFQSSSFNTAGDIYGVFAHTQKKEGLINNASENIDVTVSYPAVGDATNDGWLDYIEINARRDLKMSGDQLTFQDINTLTYPSSTFQIANTNNNTKVWNISSPTSPIKQEINVNNGELTFGTSTNTLKRFVAFNSNTNLLSPAAIGSIANQNLHGIDNVDFVIIYHKDFKSAADKLKSHRNDFNDMDVVTVNIEDIYNEFSSGSLDPTAIRDFAKMLHERSEQFKFLLLLGDASFDFKNIGGLGKNFIPTYETRESLHGLNSFPTDDYYGLLSEGEGSNIGSGELDIGVGRIPIRTLTEANTVIDKIINYDSNPASMGDWRNRLLYCADDEDGNQHVEDADSIARTVTRNYCNFNVNKIYFDAYKQVATPGGARFPKAQESINREIFKGTLVLNYLGHGGPTGWAQERVLNLGDISSWTNYNKLPLIVTATCSFAPYEDPNITSAGELALLTEKGGAIALFTTVRAVFANQNRRLAQSAFDHLFEKEGYNAPHIGEVLRIAKNSIISENSRKFALLGDPSLQLALPQYDIQTTIINGHDVSDGQPDTLRALQKVTIEGFIADNNGELLSNFNGKVYPTIYDKKKIVSTLVQDSRSDSLDFVLQKNVLFKGVASVKNGQFKFTFVVPKDIDYNYGFGKISYYAEDGVNKDATGAYKNVVIGGTDPNALQDDLGPLVEVYMNTEDFVRGGLTDENPTLLVKLSDDNGINVVGTSIGHDLTGILNENTQNTYILNDFYEAALDDYTKGEVRFPLYKLETGQHLINVKAWDIANNSAEGDTEFIVASSEEAALEHVLNYPNPFTTNTDFQFEHNLPTQDLDVQIRVFTISGTLVKTIDKRVFSDGYRITGINWNGTDDFGDPLARGVYLYKVKVQQADAPSINISTESEFEKLVILK